MVESILATPEDRYIVKYRYINELYLKHRNSFWLPSSIKFDEDMAEWNRMSNDERSFVKQILAFFAGADIIVGDNIRTMFVNEIKLNESQWFYTFQSTMEQIHNETYKEMIDVYITDPAERKYLLNASENIDCIKRKAQWAMKWMDPSLPIGERIVAFICVEGIHFCSSFAGIYWLREQGMLKSLCAANGYIARDENLHVEHGMYLFNLLQNKPSERRVHEIFREAVELEIDFTSHSIPCTLIGLSSSDMKDYVQNLANDYLTLMGVSKLYEQVENPFPWMELISMKVSSSFFEVEPVDYKMFNQAGVDPEVWDILNSS